MDEDLIPPIPKGEKLFASDKDWWNNACLHYTPHDWGLYSAGYKMAADLLVDHVAKTKADQDILVYPIGFLYRQYLEVQLKELVNDASLLLGKPAGYPTGHCIEQLWRKCRKLLEEFWPPAEEHPDFDAVEDYIRQFVNLDPKADGFRYPTLLDNTLSLPGVTHINLRKLREIMDGVSGVLELASVGVGVYLDFKQETDAGR